MASSPASSYNTVQNNTMQRSVMQYSTITLFQEETQLSINIRLSSSS